jgi:hypothetical protein
LISYIKCTRIFIFERTNMGNPSDDNFKGESQTISRLHAYSYGIVASNKVLGSRIIEATPVEDLPMLDGQITDIMKVDTLQGKDASGATYSATLNSSVSISATWLPFGSSNRVTAPDVRRGETVMLYRYADSEKYFWTTLSDDLKLRKLETVIWAYSASKVESDPSDADTTYYLEISAHKKLVHFHTSKANGEPYGYDVQINTGEGYITITDTDENYIYLNSEERRIELNNADGSNFNMLGSVLTITTPDEIIHNTSKYTINTDTFNLNASATANIASGKTTIDSVTEITQAATLDSTLTVGALASLNGGFSASGKSTGGSSTIGGGVSVSGGANVDTLTSAGNITAPNIH